MELTITQYLIVVFGYGLSLVLFISFALLFINERKKKDACITGLAIAVGKLRNFVKEHSSCAEQIDIIFRSIECYVPDEDKKLLRSIFYKEDKNEDID